MLAGGGLDVQSKLHHLSLNSIGEQRRLDLDARASCRAFGMQNLGSHHFDAN
jgi:hypothetical protein